RVLTAAKAPISGLYAVGNCCGQRYAVQYPTPAAGNSCGSAFTTGYLCAGYLKADLEAAAAESPAGSSPGTSFTSAIS
ncbi:MAG: hypothetical protein K6C08_04395, partial [Oscillospiraceae bacterium]|nr:hypothetical protein [Oscillospiraceae bacterium]